MEIMTAVLAFLNANQGLSILLAAAVAAGTFLQSAASTKAANQPSVSAALEQAPEAESIVLVITNTGRSPAHDVRVVFDPPLPEDEPSSSPRLVHFLRLRYVEPVPTLVPGTRLSNVYAGFPEDHDEHYGTPQQVTVTVSYRGLGRLRRFKSIYHLDVELMRGETYSLASDSIRGLMKEYRKRFASIDKSLQAMSRRP